MSLTRTSSDNLLDQAKKLYKWRAAILKTQVDEFKESLDNFRLKKYNQEAKELSDAEKNFSNQVLFASKSADATLSSYRGYLRLLLNVTSTALLSKILPKLDKLLQFESKAQNLTAHLKKEFDLLNGEKQDQSLQTVSLAEYTQLKKTVADLQKQVDELKKQLATKQADTAATSAPTLTLFAKK